MFAAFAKADFAQTIRLLDKHFDGPVYSMKSLFRNEQRKILNTIFESTLKDAEGSYRKVYDRHAPLMRYLQDAGIPLPRALYLAAEFTLNVSLRRALENESLNPDTIRNLLEEVHIEKIPLDVATLEYALRRTLERMADRFGRAPTDLALLQPLEAAAGLLKDLPFSVHLWSVQNLYYEVLTSAYPDQKRKAQAGDETAGAWTEHFLALGEKLSFQVPD
jgi:hypothetical protein